MAYTKHYQANCRRYSLMITCPYTSCGLACSASGADVDGASAMAKQCSW